MPALTCRGEDYELAKIHYVSSVNENTAMIGKAAAVALAKRPYVK
jgi:hypothetical protein